MRHRRPAPPLPFRSAVRRITALIVALDTAAAEGRADATAFAADLVADLADLATDSGLGADHAAEVYAAAAEAEALRAFLAASDRPRLTSSHPMASILDRLFSFAAFLNPSFSL